MENGLADAVSREERKRETVVYDGLQSGARRCGASIVEGEGTCVGNQAKGVPGTNKDEQNNKDSKSHLINKHGIKDHGV